MNNELKAICVRLSALEAKVGTLASPETTADVCNMFDQMGGRNICRTCGYRLGAHKAYKKPTADVEGLSERDRWLIKTAYREGYDRNYPQMTESDYCKNAPPSDDQVDQLTWRAEAKKLRVENKRLKAEGCRCPCHSEGLWKLPDEITRIKKVVDGYHETLKATKAELDIAYERMEYMYRMNPVPGKVVLDFKGWFKCGRAIRPQENEDE